MYNDKLVYKAVIWVYFGVILWKEKEALITIQVVGGSWSRSPEFDHSQIRYVWLSIPYYCFIYDMCHVAMTSQ